MHVARISRSLLISLSLVSTAGCDDLLGKTEDKPAETKEAKADGEEEKKEEEVD